MKVDGVRNQTSNKMVRAADGCRCLVIKTKGETRSVAAEDYSEVQIARSYRAVIPLYELRLDRIYLNLSPEPGKV